MSHELDDEPIDLSEMPVLPLRDVVIYPHMVIPLFVGRERSVKALEASMGRDQRVLLVAQREAEDEDPDERDIYQVGTIAQVLQLLRLPDGTLKVLVEGEIRAKVDTFLPENEDYLCAEVSIIEDDPLKPQEKKAVDRLVRPLLSQFDQYIKLNKKIPPEVVSALQGIDDIGRLADTIAAHISLKIADRQNLLEMTGLRDRIDALMSLMESEIDLLQMEKKIRGRVKGQMEKNQREYYLNEQIKAIQKELGEIENGVDEITELARQIEKAKMPQEAYDKAMSELKKIRQMPVMSSETAVSRNYIDWLVSLPWRKRSKVKRDIPAAKRVLNRDHYGLEEVKERILEFLAVQARVRKVKGPILCLVGPPGVGKTSLGESIARATGREFVRIALGGVRDEAEIRGHRRTYIGSMPGKIVQKMAKVKVKNPLFLLDEIDKMASDFRGDPSSALLEVLDPEQNHTFSDHYLEVDYDLSEVMFIATSNSLNIPEPLLDRMEVIRLSGYTEAEKLNIAKRYLVKKSMKDNGLKRKEMDIDDEALLDIIRYYTRESGVRSLERDISKICRKVVKELITRKKPSKEAQIAVLGQDLEKYLGVRKYRFNSADMTDQVGQVNGLAWTSVGGELLKIEVLVVPGKGKVLCTGKLGDVMQESIQAALSVVRSRVDVYGIKANFYEKHDIHVHVPEGATPKDGPSAGIGMCTGLVSALTGIPVRFDVAMTGEITLRGEVLPIGGLKEKLLAAHRGSIKTVVIPEENRKDLKEIPSNVKADLEIRPVKWIDEVLEIALSKSPKKAPKQPKKAASSKKKAVLAEK